MKIIESRPVSEDIVLMSWSPKMDLIALGSEAGEVFLHRLSWQRIWHLHLSNKPNEEVVTPEIIAWHPEGIFLSVAAGNNTYIIDIESGKIVHNHEMRSNIVSMNWCSSKYDVPTDEAIVAQPRQQPDFLRNDLKIQRLESQLSILILGTEDGIIYTYTGGFLLASIMKIPCPSDMKSGKCEVAHGNVTRGLDSFVFLALVTQPSPVDSEETSVLKETSFLCFSHFRNQLVEKIAPVLSPLGFKYLFFHKNWSLIQSELVNLNEEWSKLVDMHKNYMTYGQEKEFHEVRADYMELLFTGISTVEMEIYLGKGGREKEVKRNASTMNSVLVSMSDHIKNVKSALVFMQTELNELGGFLNQVARVSEAKSIIRELRKSFSYLYLAALHIQSLVETFLDVFHDFVHLILNTIHLINIQETPDFIEEDMDVDKILKFLDMKVEKDIFDFLLVNAPIVFRKPQACFEPIKLPKSASKKILAEKRDAPFPHIPLDPLHGKDRDWKSFPEFISEFLQEQKKSNHDGGGVSGSKKFIGHDFILDYPEEKVLHLFKNLSPTIDKLTGELCAIPVLCTMPFTVDTFPIAEIPPTNTNNSEKDSSENCVKMNARELKEKSGLLTNSTTQKSLAYLLWDSRTVYLFDYDFSSTSTTNGGGSSSPPSSLLLKAHSLNFSLKVTCVDFFAENYLSILTFDEEDDMTVGKQSETATSSTGGSSSSTTGRSILCHLNIEKIEENSTTSSYIDMKKFLNFARQKDESQGLEPGEVNVDIPRDFNKSSSNPSCPCLDYAFPIEAFQCSRMAVSGARKVGALMADSKKSIFLVDMELEVPESSFDEGDTANEYSSQTISEVTL